MSTEPLGPPTHIYLDTINSSLLTVSWDPAVSDSCPAIHYNIVTYNCGVCPSLTALTNATRSELNIDDLVCNFGVQTVVCNGIAGSMLTYTNIKLKGNV